MKILLTDPIWSLKQRAEEMRSVMTNSFNYGFACLSAYLKERGHHVTVVDPARVSMEAFTRLVREGEFDLCGITVWTTGVLKTYDTVRFLKEHSPNSRVVLGGVHPTLLPERTLEECPQADFVIIGEGEKPLLALADALDGGVTDFGKLPSLVYRKDGGIVLNPRCEPLKPEEIPFPDYAGGHIDRYRANLPHFKHHPTYQVSFSRGCPLNCGFCNAFQALGKKVRFKPVEKALEELIYLRDEYGARGFSFLDSTFTINRRWIREFCEAYRKEIGLPWMCFTRVDCVNDEMVALMKDSGCWQIGFGLESANQKTLDSIQKGTTVEQNAEAIRLCKKHGIRVYASFILGWPGETHEEAMRTVKWSIRKAIPCALYLIPVPFPDTRLRELAVEDGGMPGEMDWSVYDSNFQAARAPIYVNPLIGADRMARLHRVAILKHYSSPRVVWKYVASLTTRDQWAALPSMVLAFLRFIGAIARRLLPGKNERAEGR